MGKAYNIGLACFAAIGYVSFTLMDGISNVFVVYNNSYCLDLGPFSSVMTLVS